MIDRALIRSVRIIGAALVWASTYVGSAKAAVPSAPTMQTPVSNSELNITVTWLASATGTVTGYQLERCKNSGCTTFAQITAVGATVTSFADNTLNSSSIYRYRVRATSSSGSSSYSAIGTATTQAFAAPTALTATVASATAINLNFTNSTSGGASNTLVERCTGTSCSNFVQVGTTTAATYSDIGLTAQTSYRYRIRATDPVGNLTAYTSTVSAKTLAAPDTEAPTAPKNLSSSPVSETQINLSWMPSTDNVAVKEYRVERCDGAGCSNFTQIATPTTRTYNNTGLSAGTSYSYRVRAIDAAGNLGPYSTVSSAVTLDTEAPTAPTLLNATPGPGTLITLTWEPASDNVRVTAYMIDRCAGTDCSLFTQIGTAMETSYVDSAVIAGGTYSYRVSARDAATNVGPDSEIVQASTTPSSSAYVYDSKGRLQTVTTSSGSVIHYTYDAAGNLVGISTTP